MITATLLATAAVSGSPGAARELEEVIVSVRRIEEDARRLPLAIDVTADAIGPGHVQDLGSLALSHPGLAFESFWGGSGATPILRGLSQPSAAGDNVGVFVDDVRQANRSALDIVLLDLDRIEIVRGPQNTLYGHSTFAGAINYVSAQPTAAPTGMLQMDAGSDAARGVRAAWSQRLAGSAWLARIAGDLRESQGTWRSVEGERLGGFRRGSAVLTLDREQRDARDDEVRLNVRYNRGSFATPASTTLDAFDFNCGARGPGPGYWSYFCGHAPADGDPSLTPDLPASRSDTTQASLRYGHLMGTLRMRWLGSYYQSGATSYRDFDGSAAGFCSGVCTEGYNCNGSGAPVTRFAWPNVVNVMGRRVRELSQEIRLESAQASGPQWLLGVASSWNRADDRSGFGVDRGALLPTEHLTSIVAADPSRAGATSQLDRALVVDSRRQQVPQNESVARQWQLAAYGALQWPLFAGSTARAELRAERETQRLEGRLAAFRPDTSPDPAPVRFTTLTPRVSVDLARGAHWYGYLSLARGARSGGFNTAAGLDPRERSFRPEYNWTTELAARFASTSTLRLARVTLYRTDWRQAQITGLATTPGVGALITTNTAGILAHGIEVAFSVQGGLPVRLDVSGSLAATAFRRGSDDVGSRAFCGLTAPTPTSDFCTFGPPRSGFAGSIALVPYLDGNQLGRAPRTSGNAALVLQPLRLPGDWQLTGRVSLAWQDDAFERPINGLRYGERELLSARATFSRHRWQIALWADNLTDARYVATAASRGGAFFPSLPRPSDLLYGDRRRYGLTVAIDLSVPGSATRARRED